MPWRLPEIPARTKKFCSEGIFTMHESRAVVIESPGALSILKIEHWRPTDPSI
jgi:hypothetical protein